jgi:hypothetical protein
MNGPVVRERKSKGLRGGFVIARGRTSMIPKSVRRFSEKIMLH